MINRRLLRIKVLQSLYAHMSSEGRSLQVTEKELLLSIRRAYDLYHYLLLLPVEIRDLARKKMDIAREKLRPSYEDLHPNTRFVDNKIINQIAVNRNLLDYLTENKLSWINYPELVRRLFTDLQQTDFYNQYMQSDVTSYENDRNFTIWLYTDFFPASEFLSQILEEQSIFWNDEPDYIMAMIIKTLKKFREEQGPNAPLMKMFRNEEDREFAPVLLRKALLHYQEYLELIHRFCENWDIERIAFFDKLILITATAEAVEFPFIPTRVTMNEYIDIAKLYSTQQSGIFVNGLLDKIFHHLKESGRIVKKGKGLIGEL